MGSWGVEESKPESVLLRIVFLKEKEMINSKTFIVTGALFGVIGVLLGAMASHALKSVLPENLMMSFNTGVRYQMYHAITLLALAPSLPFLSKKLIAWIYSLFTLGVLLFSGSIYLLSMRLVFNLDVNWLGPITPIGGILLITAWFLVILAAVLKKVD